MLDFRRGVNESMTPNPYRAAYEKALEDLKLITTQFERLETRKKHVENLITTLQPMVMSDGHAGAEGTMSAPVEVAQTAAPVSVTTDEAEEAASTYSYLDVPAPLPDSDGDPFRRVKTSFRFRGLTAQRS